MGSNMKFIFFFLLEVLYVSALEFEGSCKYARDPWPTNISETFNTNQDLFCRFDCHLPENTEIYEENTDCALSIILSNSTNFQDFSNFTMVGNKNVTDKFELVLEQSPDHMSVVIYIITKENKPLEYNEKEDYTFFIEAGSATGEGLILVLVKINVCEPPVWTEFPSLVKMAEFSAHAWFNITAIPGRGCDKKVIRYFSNNTVGRETTVFIQETTGRSEIWIQHTGINSPINYLSFDVFAYYAPGYSGGRKGHVMVLIDDTDDYSPTIHPRGRIWFNSTGNGTILYDINVTDIDLGYNSVYDVLLNVPAELREAVEINPTRGAGNTTLELKINSDKVYLDRTYYKHTLEFTVKVQGVKNPYHWDSLIVEITFPKKNSASRFENIIWILVLWIISVWM